MIRGMIVAVRDQGGMEMGGRSDDVTIYGCGMSGLVAAINLARQGIHVTVHDREPGYGGSRLFNPSTHATPLDQVNPRPDSNESARPLEGEDGYCLGRNLARDDDMTLPNVQRNPLRPR